MAAEYYHERSSVTYDRFGGARIQTWDMVHSGSTTTVDSDGLGGYKYSHHVLSSKEEAPAAKLNRSMGFPEGMFQRRSDINRNDYISYQNGDGKSTNERTTKHAINGYATDHAAREYLTMTCNNPSSADQPGDGGGWKTSKAHATPVSRATNDIGTAVNHLRESPRPPAATVSSTPAGANRWKSGTPAMVEQYSYSSSAEMMTIDSREAAKKYNGYFM